MTEEGDPANRRSMASAHEDIDGGQVFWEYVEDALNDERARRTYVETRGSSLITTTAALSALAFAATALVTNRRGYVPPLLTLWALGLTFLAFMVAALAGLLAARAIGIKVVTARQLMKWRNDERKEIWGNTRDDIAWLIIKARIVELESLRAGTDRKMAWAKRGWGLQVVALFGLVVAGVAILAKAIWPDLAGWHDLFKRPR